MTNAGASPAEGVVAAAIGAARAISALGAVRKPVAPGTRFAMRDGRALARRRAGLRLFAGRRTLAVIDAPYRAEYRAKDYDITDRAETGWAVYRRTLEPGESFCRRVQDAARAGQGAGAGRGDQRRRL